MSKQAIATRIEEQVARLTKSSRFKDWLKEEKPGKDGLVLINSSFLYRKLKTTKSNSYLAIAVKAGGQPSPDDLKVATGPKFNTDFKFFPTTSAALSTEDLRAATDRELKRLGSIVMVLVGDVDCPASAGNGESVRPLR